MAGELSAATGYKRAGPRQSQRHLTRKRAGARWNLVVQAIVAEFMCKHLAAKLGSLNGAAGTLVRGPLLVRELEHTGFPRGNWIEVSKLWARAGLVEQRPKVLWLLSTSRRRLTSTSRRRLSVRPDESVTGNACSWRSLIVRGVFTDIIIFEGEINKPKCNKDVIGGIRETAIKDFTDYINTKPRTSNYIDECPKPIKLTQIKELKLDDNHDCFITGEPVSCQELVKHICVDDYNKKY